MIFRETYEWRLFFISFQTFFLLYSHFFDKSFIVASNCQWFYCHMSQFNPTIYFRVEVSCEICQCEPTRGKIGEQNCRTLFPRSRTNLRSFIKFRIFGLPKVQMHSFIVILGQARFAGSRASRLVMHVCTRVDSRVCSWWKCTRFSKNSDLIKLIKFQMRVRSISGFWPLGPAWIICINEINRKQRAYPWPRDDRTI